MANTTSFSIGRQVFAINGFGKYSCTSGFSNPAWTAEQKCLRQLIIFNGIFQCIGNMLLTNNGLEGCRAVFAG